MEAMKKGSDFYIPTYVINMKERLDRKKHIIAEFKGRDEFDVTYMDACTHTIGAVGLWNSIVRIIRLAIENEDDVIVICEDDHYFTKNYSKEFLIENILEAHEQGADVLSGGIGGFGYAVPIARNRYWVDWFWCTQFIVIFKPLFNKILEYDFQDNDTADGVLSVIAKNKMTVYPFLSIQTDFGYSDVTASNDRLKGLISRHFQETDKRLAMVHNISHHFND